MFSSNVVYNVCEKFGNRLHHHHHLHHYRLHHYHRHYRHFHRPRRLCQQTTNNGRVDDVNFAQSFRVWCAAKVAAREPRQRVDETINSARVFVEEANNGCIMYTSTTVPVTD